MTDPDAAGPVILALDRLERIASSGRLAGPENGAKLARILYQDLRPELERAGRGRVWAAVSSRLLDEPDGVRASLARPSSAARRVLALSYQERRALMAEEITRAQAELEQRATDAARVASALESFGSAAGRVVLRILLGAL